MDNCDFVGCIAFVIRFDDPVSDREAGSFCSAPQAKIVDSVEIVQPHVSISADVKLTLDGLN